MNWEIVGQVVDDLTRIIWRAGNTVTQRSARAASGVATGKTDKVIWPMAKLPD